MGKKLPAFVAQWGTIDPPAFYEGQKGWGNHNEPDVYVVDVNQDYPIGTFFHHGSESFCYGYCHENVSVGGRAMGGMMNVAAEVYSTAKAVAHVVGETKIVIVDNTSTVNQWAGGYYMPRVHPYSSHRILSSTAHDGTNVTLTLERGLLTELASGGRGFLNQHPYSKLSCQLPNAGDTFVSAMGVNLVTAVAGTYMWVQSWGPCYVTGGDELLGKAATIRTATFHQDGTLHAALDTEDEFQLAGYAIPKTSTSLSTWFVYLQIAR